MGRWDANARERLERAAYDLFVERGYDASTVADIAARAGLTERTFFRHFADKREVVFARGSAALRDAMARAVADAPAAAAPFAVVRAAIEAATRFFFGERAMVLERSRMIAAHADLRERAVTKRAALTTELLSALRSRGFAEPEASLAAEIGIAVFYVAFDRWLEADETRELVDVAAAFFDGLTAVVADRV